MTLESKQNLFGKYTNGKMLYVIKGFNYMRKTKTHPNGGGGVYNTGMKQYEFEVDSENLIDGKWYRFDVINGKAIIKNK